jgi:hypothetical protein
MRRLEKMLLNELDRARNEREIHPFLKRHLIIVRNALNTWAWNHVEVIPEFRFGSEYRADFLILSADSGSWHATFVELKSHRTRLFTKEGIPTKSLNVGLRQLDDWGRWLNRHENVFRNVLSKHFMKNDVAASCSASDRHTTAATEITDPRTVLNKHYRVVIGRRSHLTIEDQERRASFSSRDREIVTFDRFLDVARKLDTAEKEIKKMRRLTTG